MPLCMWLGMTTWGTHPADERDCEAPSSFENARNRPEIMKLRPFDSWTLGHLDTWTLRHLDTWTLGHVDLDIARTPEIHQNLSEINILENKPEHSRRLVKALGITGDVS